ncbi:MAG: DNA translocase FtsK 4TM domain-containing protein, partial [Hyphomicrobium sp.]
MSLDTRGIDPQRLLPQSVEDRLLSWLSRFGGVLLLALALLVWASLVSWSALDPSLTHTTTAPVHNFAGPVGAIISDLLFQMLGFGAVLALIAPVVWGIEMLRAERVVDGRVKLGFYPLSILALTGAISALPVLGGWPLRHGYGGLVGDGVYHLALKLFGMLNEERAPIAAGVVLFAAAVQTCAKAMGFEAEGVMKAFLRSLGSGVRYASSKQRLEDVAALAPSLAASANRARKGWFGSAPQSAAASDASYRSLDLYAGDATSPTLDLNPERTVRPRRPEVGRAPESELQSGLHDDRHESHLHDSRNDSRGTPAGPRSEGYGGHADDFGEPGLFDDVTDSSRAIARRFAPASAAHAAATDDDDEPTLVIPPVPKPAPPRAAPVSKPAVANSMLAGMARNRSQPVWRRPSLNMLKRPGAQKPRPELSQTVMRGNARLLEDVLADFGVKGEVKDIRPGPVVTLYEFEPSRGTKSSRIIGLAEDIARSMSVA